MNAALTFGTKRSFRAKQIINDFLTYVRKPLYISEDASMSKTEKFQYLFKVLLCKLALLPILIPIIYFTKQLTGAKSIGWEDTWSMYLMLVVFAPIVEEAIFRGLLHYSRWGVSFIVSILLVTITYLVKITELISIQSIGFVYFACIVLFPIFHYFTKPFDDILKTFWARNFKYIFHIIAISFGLVHLTNYTGINNYLFALPLVTSQIISGYVLGFVRMKLGFGYGVALHSAWNFIASFGMLVVLLAKFF
ncbi:MAG: type II CAAX prenyl endopeptidase Rce1 family protein [Emticicia sp.]